ncbi:transcriptional regulator, LacI family [Pleomorphomonas diazotrophica]|uniref:LacI family DNA-binding transcriptional regulator n=1 Tax=Pleomorphomonas diazotrophica TaxID=1166257 RepID=UPI0008ECB45E|nr:LacI family DNA-binding transcriptional regulator [Pleomorphomonas diazotrophica]SFM97706.1 transcriptional regulator, LacI family [Pleomorphomonas diazotrophica]
MQPTIYDVAKAAGVSISTVSLALNRPERVSRATRERVLGAIDALGFVPRAEAVAKARRGLKRIGVVGPFTRYPSYRRRVAGVVEAASAAGFEVVIYDSLSATEAEAPLLDSLPLTGRVDALMIVSLPVDDAALDRLTDLSIEAVLVDGRRPGLDCVFIDNARGGALAAEHLMARGCRSFALLGERTEDAVLATHLAERGRGYVAALEARGHRVPEENRITARMDLQDATAAAMALLSRPDRPDAVFAASDLLAAGVLSAARALGLGVPEDVAVVGFDDGTLAEALGLTSIRQPFEESGRVGFDLLQRRLGGGTGTREVQLGLELIERGTS